MNRRELILLSPYRLPAQHSLKLAEGDMAAWMHCYSALWHPAALWQASGPPRVEFAYEHETPRPGCLYAVPISPLPLLSEDWTSKVQAAGAHAFRAGLERSEALENMLAALQQDPQGANGDELDRLARLPESTVAPFLAIGLGYLLLATLCEAMEHENLLHTSDFWFEVQRAVAACADLPPPERPPAKSPPVEVPDAHDEEYALHARPTTLETPSLEASAAAAADSGLPQFFQYLQAAAARLLAARETLYPVVIHMLDAVELAGDRLDNPWPVSWKYDQPINVMASGAVLERMQRGHPAQLAALKERLEAKQAEICGGNYLERDDPLLPVESQWWNLRKGVLVTRAILGVEVKVYACKSSAAHPQLPLWLQQHGMNHAVLFPFDEEGFPPFTCTVINWSTQDGKRIECFLRKPLRTDSVEAFFNLGHYLFKTTREDTAATLAFLHGTEPPLPWFSDLLELSRFGPVIGRWTTFGTYCSEVGVGDYAGPMNPDDFRFDYLSDRVPPDTSSDAAIRTPLPKQSHPTAIPVSGFARHLRLRRRLDACWTLSGIHRGLTGRRELAAQEQLLAELEDQIEVVATAEPPADALARLAELENQFSEALAQRLLARAAEQQPGYLLLNPCGFTRRVALELAARGAPIPVVDPVKACQKDGDKLHVVVEIPPLGFAWLPQAGPPGAAPPAQRMRLADERSVRNEFFEAEIDPATGGLRAIRDHKSMLNRLSQRLVFHPGATMKASKIATTSIGPALGEIVTEGTLVGAQGQVLAQFRQRFRAWLGRPILDLRIELYPEQPPAGSGWHAYYGAQFAWRDERAVLLRGQNGTSYITTTARPLTPDFLELRLAGQSTAIFPGGLPFHQREGGRMLDIVLIPPGETAQVFDLALGLDRPQPMQTALGLDSPTLIVPTSKGPPHIGTKGWLFHLDAPNLMLSSLRPGGLGAAGSKEPEDAVTAKLLECASRGTEAEFRCVRDPRKVTVIDGLGRELYVATSKGDAALFHAAEGEWVQVQVQFSG